MNTRKEDNYVVEIINQDKKSIYGALNVMLDILGNGEYYIVIGVGDRLYPEDIDLSTDKRVIGIRYSLGGQEVDKAKNIKKGMPFSHNAIVVKNCNLRYDERIVVVADYDYIMRYILKWNIKEIAIADQARVEIDRYGFSKRKRKLRIKEDFGIIRKYFGLKDAIKYLVGGFLIRFGIRKRAWERNGLNLED